MKFSRKNLGRAASTLLAAAMLAAFTALPASADALGSNGIISGSVDSAISEITIPVTVHKPEKGYTPDVKLKVSVADATDAETSSEKIEADGGYTVDVHNGINAASIKVKPEAGSDGESLVFSSASDGIGGSGAGSATVSKNVVLDLSALSGFTTPGVYKYTISTTVDGVTPGEFTKADNLLMYLFVADKGGSNYVVTGAVVKKNDKSEKVKEIANFYMVDPSDPTNPLLQKVADLTIENNVTGAMGDHSEAFTFTLNITTGKSYHAVKTTLQRGTETMELKAGQNTFTLKDGESIIIYSLEKDTVFNLKENGKEMGYTVTTVDGKYSDGTGYDVSLTGNQTISFTNDRKAITPTGVVVSVAPYALLVLVAAAAGFVFLRKRRED